jgi:HJR/Mrr/RecB family endonuclease
MITQSVINVKRYQLRVVPKIVQEVVAGQITVMGEHLLGGDSHDPATLPKLS